MFLSQQIHQKMTEKPQGWYAEDDKAFIEILNSMGVSKFDPLVPIALNEYARRFATELLCDAKDYSVHSKKSEIDEDDMNLAIKLCDTKVTGVHERRKMIEEMKAEINRQSLIELANRELIVNRYLPGSFPHRSYTYVPGMEAYEEYLQAEKEDATAGKDMEVDGSQSQSSVPPAISINLQSSMEKKKKSSTSKSGPLEPAAGFSADE